MIIHFVCSHCNAASHTESGALLHNGAVLKCNLCGKETKLMLAKAETSRDQP
jgi:transcription elongation factor Elf1